ncbi:MAG: hypothetical protein H7145_12260 [Akkermansiaceae bacterium]|nr:hypothetical protein [Armatimonadota bacterium]
MNMTQTQLSGKLFVKQIIQEQMRQWLREADDSEELDCPATFDYEAAIREVEFIKPRLERIVGRELQIDRDVQDASFFTDLGWIQLSDKSPTWNTIFAVRFSTFGKLTTIWSVCPDDQKVSQNVMVRVTKELLASGYRHVDKPLLCERYDGRHPLSANANWFNRFFDYI